MSATAHPAEQLAGRERPPALDREALKLRERWRDGSAPVVRAPVGDRFHAVHDQVEIHRQPDPHLMQRLAGRNHAVVGRDRVGLGVDEMAFDVPEAVVTEIATAFDGTGVMWLARNRGR